jgi:hypothetical protein
LNSFFQDGKSKSIFTKGKYFEVDLNFETNETHTQEMDEVHCFCNLNCEPREELQIIEVCHQNEPCHYTEVPFLPALRDAGRI